MIDNVDLIIVTGAQRSAASIVTGTIAISGAWCSVPVKPWDVRSNLEDMEVYRAIVKPAMRGLGADPRGQRPLPLLERCEAVAKTVSSRWRDRLLSILESGGYGGGPVVLESSAACLSWPIWNAAFPAARWVIVRRRDGAIIESCMRTRYMAGYKDREGWAHWLSTIKGRFEQLKGIGAHEVWVEPIFEGNLGDLADIVRSVGLTWDENAARSMLAPIAWQNGCFDESISTGGEM